MSDKKWNPPKKVDLKREGAWQLTTYMQFMRENLKKKKKNLSRCQCTPKNTGSMLCKLC